MLSIALIMSTSLSAQTEFYYEDFDNGLPDGWQSLEVTGDGAPSASWIWTDTGPAGAFATDPLASESAANGWMIFDSDLNCSGEQETWLISAPIDCSNRQNVVVEFNTYYRRWNDVTSIEVSTDLTNWTSVPVFDGFGNAAYSGSGVNDGGQNPTIELAVISEVADGQPKVFIAFKFLADQTTVQVNSDIGCAYNWQVDDVRLLESNTPDGKLNYSFYTPISFAVPQNHADADTFGYDFIAGIQNIGALPLENGVAKVEIVNEGTGETIFTQSVDVPTIAVGTADTIDINPGTTMDNYFPTGLDVGSYSYTISVDFPGSGEVNLDDNFSPKYFFDISADYFAQENGDINDAIRLDPTQGWKVGASYWTSPNIQDSIIVSAIITSIQSDSTRLNDNYVRFGIMRNLEEYAFGGDFDRNNADPFNHPDFESAVYDDFYLFTNEVSEEVIEIPVGDDDNPVYLRRGSIYTIFAAFDEEQAGEAALPNNQIRIGINNYLPDAQHFIVFDNDDLSWYTGYTTFDFSLHLRLVLKSDASGVDNNPLPEHVFQVSPNPASDHIMAHINFEENSNMNLMIMNIEGRILSMKDYDAVSQMDKRIDVSNYANGTYFIKLSTLKGTKTHKFIIQH